MSVPPIVADDVIAHYRREGYGILRGLLEAQELQQVRRVFDGLADLRTNVVNRFARRLVVTRNLWQSDPAIKALVWRIGPVAAQFMGVRHARLVDDVALIKPAKEDGGEPTIWHQDAPNFPFDRRGFLTIWIAVDDVPLEQGPLTFLPRSHRLGLLGAIDGGGEELGLDALLTPDDFVHVGEPVTTPLAAGDASVHNGYLLHAAGPNQTSRPRRAWGVRFIPPETLYTGGAHRSFDALGLRPFHPFDHDNHPVIESGTSPSEE